MSYEYVIPKLRKNLELKATEVIKYKDIVATREKELISAQGVYIQVKMEHEELLNAINLLTITGARDDE